MFIAVIIGVVFTFVINSNSAEVKVNKNVTIINKEETESIPIETTENQLVFNTKQDYSEGDVIVSGITDTSPNGFLRKVVKTETIDNKYIVETTNACLTDVFEEAHISRTFKISEDSITPVDSLGIENAKIGLMIPKKSLSTNLEIGTIIPTEDSNDDLFTLGIEKELTKNISVTGSIGYRPFLIVEIDIVDSEIEFTMAIKNSIDGSISLKLSSEADFEKSIEIFNKNLKTLEFMAGEVPIVITNALNVTLDGSGYIGGSLSTGLILNCENTTGFKYSSATNKVEEIKESKYLGDGIEWETKATANAGIEVGVFLHLVSKIYDVSGPDLAFGITGKAECEVTASPNKQFNNLYYAGNIDLAIQPKLKGNIVVDVPVIDYRLIDQPLFEVGLKPLWEKHWESSGNWKDDIDNVFYDSLTPDSELYQIIYTILKDNKESFEYWNHLCHGRYIWEELEQIYSWWTSDGLTGKYIGNAIPVYSIKDMDNNSIPDLIIGTKENNKYSFILLFNLYTLKESDSKKLSADWKYLDSDNCNGYTPSELNWKEFEEFSKDLEIKNIPITEETIFSNNNFNVNVCYKMIDSKPFVLVKGTNGSNKDHYIILAKGKNEYLEADLLSNNIYVQKSETKFEGQFISDFWNDVKTANGEYEFYIVISDMNGEIFRKKLIVK